jgi:hypothetical protein
MSKFDPERDSMRKMTLAVAAAVALVTATMMPAATAAARRGSAGQGYVFGRVQGDQGFGGGYGRGHGYRSYRRGYSLLWYPNYGYDYGSYGYEDGDSYGDDYGTTAAPGDIANETPPPIKLPEPPHAAVTCKETVTVPSQDGGTRQIGLTRC